MAPSNCRSRNPRKIKKCTGEGLPSMDQNKLSSSVGSSKHKRNSISSLYSSDHLRKGPWSASEDEILVDYVKKHGEGGWAFIHKRTKLLRCGKSCRLRWVNHLRPNLKRGPFSAEEKNIIFELHARLGNKWSQIAAHLPGRTDNEIKNFWYTRIKNSRRVQLGFNSSELCSHENYESAKCDNLDHEDLQNEASDGVEASDGEIVDTILSSFMFHETVPSDGPAIYDLPASGLDVNCASCMQYSGPVSTVNQCHSDHQPDYCCPKRSGSDEICLSQIVPLTCSSAANTSFGLVKIELPSVQYPETSLSFVDKRSPSPEVLISKGAFLYSPCIGETQSRTSSKITGLLDDIIPVSDSSYASVHISSSKDSVSYVHSPCRGMQISTNDVCDSTVEVDWEDCLASPLDPSTASIFHGCTPTIMEVTSPNTHTAMHVLHGNNMTSEPVEQILHTDEVRSEISDWLDTPELHDSPGVNCMYWGALFTGDAPATDDAVVVSFIDDAAGTF